jgi:glycosyltransferase involved in cell wall biosynthesis
MAEPTPRRNTPLVSVITATRNRPHLLQQALLSLKQQDYSAFEAIIVDDGSTHEAHEKYRTLWADLDERFTLHLACPVDGPGSGPGRGRNVGLSLAKGTFVAFLDHDDLFASPDHLSVGVRALTEADADYYFTHVRLEPAHPSLVGFTPPELLESCPRILDDSTVRRVPIADFLRVMKQHHIHPSHSITRRDLLQRAGGFVEGLKTFDDINLMFRLADQARGILYRPEPAVAIRLPEGKSFSLASSRLDQALSAHHALLDARVRCHTRAVRRCARAREAWVLRELSDHVSRLSRAESCRLAWESLTTFPTAGAAWFLAKAIITGLSGIFRSQAS